MNERKFGDGRSRRAPPPHTRSSCCYPLADVKEKMNLAPEKKARDVFAAGLLTHHRFVCAALRVVRSCVAGWRAREKQPEARMTEAEWRPSRPWVSRDSRVLPTRTMHMPRGSSRPRSRSGLVVVWSNRRYVLRTLPVTAALKSMKNRERRKTNRGSTPNHAVRSERPWWERRQLQKILRRPWRTRSGGARRGGHSRMGDAPCFTPLMRFAQSRTASPRRAYPLPPRSSAWRGSNCRC